MTQEERDQLDMEWRALAYVTWSDAGGDKYWKAVERMAEIERLLAADEKV